MHFEPKPADTFSEFIETYYTRCKACCPGLLAIAGKWTFEDLIPGLSDFDTRFIFADDTTVENWMAMSLAVGAVHTDLAKARPEWARILEHLPGLDLTVSEVTDPKFYYPEFQQWSYYRGDPETIERITSYLAAKPWTVRDELFHLKKFALYCGPYLRGIDPPINMGPWESKYPLHSRFMHYFTPPVQSAVSILLGKGQKGKFASLKKARELFDKPEVIDMILDAVDRHYEIPAYYAEPKLTQIERDLESYLEGVYARLAGKLTQIDADPADSAETVKAKVKAIPVDPVESFFEGTRFCRFMKGRLLFYAEQIPWFDSIWLIHNELNRMVGNFCNKPLAAFCQVYYGQRLEPTGALDRMAGDVLDADMVDQVRTFIQLASEKIPDGQEKARARQIADHFDPVQKMIEILSKYMRGQLKA